MSVTTGMRPTRTAGNVRETEPSLSATVWMEMRGAMTVLAIASPGLLGILGGPMRLLFPLAAFVLAAVTLLRGEVARYVTVTLWIFTITPFLRRVVDAKAGWVDANTLMLAPYMAAIVCLPIVFSLLSSRTLPARSAFVAIFGAIATGLVVAVFHDRMAAGAFDSMRWFVPPVIALFIVANRAHAEPIRRHLQAYFLVAGIACSIYAFYQFVAAPQWDTFWMTSSQMISLGSPEPYAIRVFSTWNSPGPFANFLVVCILVAMVSRTTLAIPMIGLALGALAISLVRSAWVGMVVGLVVVAILGSVRQRFSALALPLVVAFVLPMAMLHPEAGKMLESRVSSMTDIGSDTSFNERLQGYADVVDSIDRSFFGDGLGATGAYNSYVNGGRVRIVDGGPAEIAVTLGAVVGLIYVVALGAIAFMALRSPRRDAMDVAFQAVIVTYVFLMTSGLVSVGETGLLWWIAMGCRLAMRPVPAIEATGPRPAV